VNGLFKLSDCVDMSVRGFFDCCYVSFVRVSDYSDMIRVVTSLFDMLWALFCVFAVGLLRAGEAREYVHEAQWREVDSLWGPLNQSKPAWMVQSGGETRDAVEDISSVQAGHGHFVVP